MDHVGGGITVGGRKNQVHLKAWSRIGVLVNQLRLEVSIKFEGHADPLATSRSLLDSHLQDGFEETSLLPVGNTTNAPAIYAILSLLASDGLS